MNTMHTFVDFVPSVLLGAPSETSLASALPGHKLFLQGKGLEAIRLAVLGGLYGTLIGIGLIPVFFAFAEQTRGFLWKTIPWVLAGTLILMMQREKQIPKKIAAIGVIGLSGTLGAISLGHGIDLLFPLVSGFFGVSTLLYSLFEKRVLVAQENKPTAIQIQSTLVSGFFGGLAGAVVSFFPAIGPGQAATTVSTIHKTTSRQYLVLLGSLNASATIFSFTALVAIDKARTGSAAAIQRLTQLSTQDFSWIVATILISSAIAALATLGIANAGLQQIQKWDYRLVTKLVIGFLLLLVFAFNGFTGIAACLTATAIGLLAPLLKIRRSHAMAFLVIPTLWYYIRF